MNYLLFNIPRVEDLGLIVAIAVLYSGGWEWVMISLSAPPSSDNALIVWGACIFTAKQALMRENGALFTLCHCLLWLIDAYADVQQLHFN